ncbi:uncharacterized protein si:dkey-9i23.16 [Ictalurus punctatus]|uniref:Uncharacterized protein si:dkey-9i23.16 n=1 Tax=Ictalurus punctatus TaxID=7998 RepID=A0A2D0QJN7_ICTPU|nr:uncharacterized protein si:dkey-9i23.16 [Ictalurus punctatus]
MRTLFSVLLDITTLPALTFLLLNKLIPESRTPAVKMAESQIEPPCKLHRLFRVYDPEVVAVMTILLGLFQVLLGFPAYYMSINIKLLHVCPVFVGAVYVAGGSFAMACIRIPSRKLVKSCLYASVFGLLVGLSAIFVYAYAIYDMKSVIFCEPEEFSHDCTPYGVFEYFNAFSALLLIYDMGALILQGLLLFSARKGLKTN